MRLVFLICLLTLVSGLYSQADSVAFSRDFTLYEGLYLTHRDFRHNWPIPKEKIITKIKKDQLDFWSKLIEDDKIEYVERDGNNATIKAEKVWGFCQNNVIYINIQQNFFRIPVFGAISFFPASVEVSPNSPANNMIINGGTNTGAREIREFLLDFYTGQLMDFNTDNLEELLQEDDALYKEYSALPRKKKKEKASLFIRKYNQKHPVYFPKN